MYFQQFINSIVSAPTPQYPHRQFIILKLFGEGGEGQVFQAQQLNGDPKITDVALKLQKTLKEEERIFTQNLINYQNEYENPQTPQKYFPSYIIRIYEIFKWNGLTVIIMEAGGQSLFDFIESNKTLNLIKKGDICKQLAKSIQMIHHFQYAHRDIKPENFIQFGNDWKLIDFGLTKAMDSTSTKQIGTVLYMAPEILRVDCSKYSEKVDVWSLAGVFYEIISGTVLFEGNNPDEVKNIIKNSHLTKKYETKGKSFSQTYIRWKVDQLQISNEWKSVLELMLKYDPVQRPSMAQVVELFNKSPIVKIVDTIPLQMKSQLPYFKIQWNIQQNQQNYVQKDVFQTHAPGKQSLNDKSVFQTQGPNRQPDSQPNESINQWVNQNKPPQQQPVINEQPQIQQQFSQNSQTQNEQQKTEQVEKEVKQPIMEAVNNQAFPVESKILPDVPSEPDIPGAKDEKKQNQQSNDQSVENQGNDDAIFQTCTPLTGIIQPKGYMETEPLKKETQIQQESQKKADDQSQGMQGNRFLNQKNNSVQQIDSQANKYYYQQPMQAKQLSSSQPTTQTLSEKKASQGLNTDFQQGKQSNQYLESQGLPESQVSVKPEVKLQAFPMKIQGSDQNATQVVVQQVVQQQTQDSIDQINQQKTDKSSKQNEEKLDSLGIENQQEQNQAQIQNQQQQDWENTQETEQPYNQNQQELNQSGNSNQQGIEEQDKENNQENEQSNDQNQQELNQFGNSNQQGNEEQGQQNKQKIEHNQNQQELNQSGNSNQQGNEEQDFQNKQEIEQHNNQNQQELYLPGDSNQQGNEEQNKENNKETEQSNDQNQQELNQSGNSNQQGNEEQGQQNKQEIEQPNNQTQQELDQCGNLNQQGNEEQDQQNKEEIKQINNQNQQEFDQSNNQNQEGNEKSNIQTQESNNKFQNQQKDDHVNNLNQQVLQQPINLDQKYFQNFDNFEQDKLKQLLSAVQEYLKPYLVQLQSQAEEIKQLRVWKQNIQQQQNSQLVQSSLPDQQQDYQAQSQKENEVVDQEELNQKQQLQNQNQECENQQESNLQQKEEQDKYSSQNQQQSYEEQSNFPIKNTEEEQQYDQNQQNNNDNQNQQDQEYWENQQLNKVQLSESNQIQLEYNQQKAQQLKESNQVSVDYNLQNEIQLKQTNQGSIDYNLEIQLNQSLNILETDQNLKKIKNSQEIQTTQSDILSETKSQLIEDVIWGYVDLVSAHFEAKLNDGESYSKDDLKQQLEEKQQLTPQEKGLLKVFNLYEILGCFTQSS